MRTLATSAIPAWFGRTFTFSLTPELLPNLCSRLRGTPARMEELLRSADAPALGRRPPGSQSRWSAQENAGHLLDLEPLWLARVNDYAAGREHLTPTDLQNRKTDEADHNSAGADFILTEFRRARNGLMQRVGELDASLHSRTIVHPRLQIPMRLMDHLQFVAEHDDHHLARIWQLLQRLP